MNQDLNKKTIVFFDFHNVLSNYDYSKKYDAEVYEKIEAILFENKEKLMNDWMDGVLSSVNLYKILSKRLNIPFEEIFDDFINGEKELQIDKVLIDLVGKLKESGVVVGVISDNADTFLQYTVPHNGLNKVFDFIISSAEYGVQKYNQGLLFDKAKEVLHLGTFENCYLIDDDKKNCKYFIDRGGHSFVYQYQKHGDLRKWLREKLAILT